MKASKLPLMKDEVACIRMQNRMVESHMSDESQKSQTVHRIYTPRGQEMKKPIRQSIVALW